MAIINMFGGGSGIGISGMVEGITVAPFWLAESIVSSYYDENYQLVSIPSYYVSKMQGTSGSSGWLQTNIKQVFFPECITVGYDAFKNCVGLEKAFLPKCTTIGGFDSCVNLKEVYAPLCKEIQVYGFNYCSSLMYADFPNCEYVGTSAFYWCGNMSYINLPQTKYVGSGAFDFVTVPSAYFPLLTSSGVPSSSTSNNQPPFVGFKTYLSLDSFNSTIGWWLFDYSTSRLSYSRTLLSGLNASATSSIYQSTFRCVVNLSEVIAVSCKFIGFNAFSSCHALEKVVLPSCTSIGAAAFYQCRVLRDIQIPNCAYVANSAFYGCSELSKIYFSVKTSFRSSVFESCRNLIDLRLYGSTFTTLANSNTFNTTPIGGYSESAGQYGSIYVPSSMLESYKLSTNWTYFADRFVGV